MTWWTKKQTDPEIIVDESMLLIEEPDVPKGVTAVKSPSQPPPPPAKRAVPAEPTLRIPLPPEQEEGAGEGEGEETAARTMDPDGDGLVQLSVADFMAMLDEAKELAYQEAVGRVREEVEAELRAKPIYRGILGFFGWIAGKLPDSHGRPSGSWTIYVLSHISILMYMGAVAYGVVTGVNYTKLTVISPWIPLFPMVLAWIGWLIHHKKLADVAVMVIDAIGRALAGFKGGGIVSATATLATTLKAPDPSLTPGKKIELKKKPEGDRTHPKTDPNSLPAAPE